MLMPMNVLLFKYLQHLDFQFLYLVQIKLMVHTDMQVNLIIF